MVDDTPRYKTCTTIRPVAGAPRRRPPRFCSSRASSPKGSRALLSMNQPGGFKCPSCAYPDADCKKTLDFCENGAKALAHEATKFRVTGISLHGTPSPS